LLLKKYASHSKGASFLLVDRQPPAHDELQSVLDAETEEARIRSEQYNTNLCALIFKRKILMPGGGLRVIRYFALDSDVVVTEEVDIDLTDELVRRVDVLGHATKL
ncbi:MAG TPA: hypothetical protein VLU46_08250, partial [Thermoanaerobaculia bacterium]|nr:hypothetical protein [Thermoanaerobaculia bacterium]